jgi:ATP-dependent DNA helicase RecG
MERYEQTTVEFKREFTDTIRRSVIAFANSDGGLLYVGIDDAGLVCGVEEVDLTLSRITNIIRDTIQPDVTLFTRCDPEIREGKTVIRIEVQRGTARPYYWKEKGIRPEGVFVRQGASSVPASRTAIFQMINESADGRYEELRSLNQDLTFTQTESFFREKELAFGPAQMRSLHFIDNDGTYTNLAWLLSDQCMHSVKLAVFDGQRKTVFRDRRELSGSLLRQVEDAYEFIDMLNRTRSDYEGLNRLDNRDYPPAAIREGLLNLIIHRDYSFSAVSLISLFEDRLEMVNLGGLLPGIGLSDIELGVSVLRNRNLAEIFYRLHLIEAYGTGLLKIRENYVGAPVQPKLEVSDNAFKLTLYNRNLEVVGKAGEAGQALHQVTPRERTVLGLLEKKTVINRRDIESECKVSMGTATILLRNMLQKQMIVKEGQGKNTTYRKMG